MAVIASRGSRHQACDRAPGALVPALVLGMLLATGSSAALEVAISADIERAGRARD